MTLKAAKKSLQTCLSLLLAWVALAAPVDLAALAALDAGAVVAVG